MNLIEQIEKLLVNDYGRVYELRKDLRAIIEQHKSEAVEPVAVPDHTKLIGELVEFVNEVNNWLVCAPIASPDDMAQSFDGFQKQCDALLTRAKEYLK